MTTILIRASSTVSENIKEETIVIMKKLACNVIIVNVQHYINGIYYRGNRYHPLAGPPGVEGWKGGRVEAWSAWLPACLLPAACLRAGVGRSSYLSLSLSAFWEGGETTKNKILIDHH